MVGLFLCWFSFILVKNNLNGLQSDICQQLETMLKEVNSQKTEITKLEERVKKVNNQ